MMQGGAIIMPHATAVKPYATPREAKKKKKKQKNTDLTTKYTFGESSLFKLTSPPIPG